MIFFMLCRVQMLLARPAGCARSIGLRCNFLRLAPLANEIVERASHLCELTKAKQAKTTRFALAQPSGRVANLLGG